MFPEREDAKTMKLDSACLLGVKSRLHPGQRVEAGEGKRERRKFLKENI